MAINTLATSTAAMSGRLADTVWFNAVWFQSVWFCTVLGRDLLLPVALALLALHIGLARDRLGELRQLVLVGGIGVTADAALSLAGVYEFSGGVLVPLWLCCLWMAFPAALGRSLSWLAGRPLLASLAGVIVFPLNYWAGQRLGAVEFGYSLPVTLVLLALIWGVLLPLMFRVVALSAPMRGYQES